MNEEHLFVNFILKNGEGLYGIYYSYCEKHITGYEHIFISLFYKSDDWINCLHDVGNILRKTTDIKNIFFISVVEKNSNYDIKIIYKQEYKNLLYKGVCI